MIRKISFVIKYLIITACSAALSAPVTFAFKDVLDKPAFKTKSSHKYLYNGMAWADKRLFSVIGALIFIPALSRFMIGKADEHGQVYLKQRQPKQS